MPEMAMQAASDQEMDGWGLSGDSAPSQEPLDQDAIDAAFAADTPHGGMGDGAPHIDSPPISADMPENDAEDMSVHEPAFGSKGSRRFGVGRRGGKPLRPNGGHSRLPSWLNLGWPGVAAALAALSIGLVVWRADVVRLMPQTGGFFRMIGMGVNLRGLDFFNVALNVEKVDGKDVLVVSGHVIATGKKPVELPRLRFIVRDRNGAEIYAWNSTMEQPYLRPGQHTEFLTRLATPPADAASLNVRFFHRHDIAASNS